MLELVGARVRGLHQLERSGSRTGAARLRLGGGGAGREVLKRRVARVGAEAVQEPARGVGGRDGWQVGRARGGRRAVEPREHVRRNRARAEELARVAAHVALLAVPRAHAARVAAARLARLRATTRPTNAHMILPTQSILQHIAVGSAADESIAVAIAFATLTVKKYF